MKISSVLIVLALAFAPLISAHADEAHDAMAKDHDTWQADHKRAKEAVRSLEKMLRQHGKAMKAHEAEVRRHNDKKHDTLKTAHDKSAAEHTQLMKIVGDIETLVKDHDKAGDHE